MSQQQESAHPKKYNLEEMRKNNLTSVSQREEKAKRYNNTILKLSKFMDKGKGKVQSTPNSIAKALLNQEKKEQGNINLLDEIASQINLLRKSIVSNRISESDREEDEEPEVKIIQSMEAFQADRVFWSKEKMEKVRGQLKMAKVKIFEKTRKDFQELYMFIDTGDKEKILYYILN
jgi:hypothetical protein